MLAHLAEVAREPGSSQPSGCLAALRSACINEPVRGKPYDRARAAADVVIDELDLDASATAWFGETVSMRWVLIHMVEETARHAGHMDILRELIDGATGGYPPD